MEPLANRIRPTSLDEYVGQPHLVGEGKPLRLAVEHRPVVSFIPWAPPGTGNAALPLMYSNGLNAEFHDLFAFSAGKSDTRNIMERLRMDDRPRVLFLDEIHRFN